MAKPTPMLEQYFDLKAKYPDTLLMFRLGDFFEMFGDDAETGSRVLGIVLTARDAGTDSKIPMCGVPHHAVDSYIATLIEHGYKVAIAEQVEDPKLTKGLVKREVVRVISPGTFTGNVDPKMNNFIASVFVDTEHKAIGMAYCDVSTGELVATQTGCSERVGKVLDELERVSPSECIIPSSAMSEGSELAKRLCAEGGLVVTCRPDIQFSYGYASGILCDQFGTSSLEGFGMCEDMKAAFSAAGALIAYLRETQMNDLSHINGMRTYHIEEFLVMDKATRRNLEILESTAQRLRNNSSHNTLLAVIDKTVTSAGGRFLRQTLERPPISKANIDARLDLVEEFSKSTVLRSDVRAALKDVYDLERLCCKVAYSSAGPKELFVLKNSLCAVEVLKKTTAVMKCDLMKRLNVRLDGVPEVVKLVSEAIADNPPNVLDDGGVIRPGYNSEVDELRSALHDGKKWLSSLEADEKEKTGIKSLKIGFNQVFGYYLEVTHANASLVPDYYIRKQTLANAERYITPELKELESKIVGAEERLLKLEREIFASVREEVGKFIPRILASARAAAEIDMCAGFAEVAVSSKYPRPKIAERADTQIYGGRHPVLEDRLGRSKVVPNDIVTSREDARLIIITGPNMAGKSTVLSTLGMITVMAHAGCFVPATDATIGIVDRIYYRTGSYDDIGSGKSTFMVELLEVASIINSATSDSLVLIDELGRGTSTFDGMALAWAVAEWIHDNIEARTMFTTHYHELAALEGSLSHARNYHVGAVEKAGELIFLYKLMRGSADKSYGINVAKMAGLPKKLLKRAEQILTELEASRANSENQFTLFGWEDDVSEPEGGLVEEASGVDDELMKMISEADVDGMSPREALNFLFELKSKVRELD